MQLRTRKGYLDIARGIAILYVVLFHISSNTFICSWLGTFQMFVFFFVSGNLFRNYGIKNFMCNKFHHIVIPYFAWGGVTLTYYLLLENRFRQLELTAKDCLIGLITGIQFKLNFNTPLWFVTCMLVTLIMYLLIYKALNKLYKEHKEKKTYVTMFLLFMICITAVQMFDIRWQIFSAYKVPGFLMAYLCGDVFGRFLTNKLEQRSKWQHILMGIVLLVVSGLLHKNVHINMITIVTGVMGTMLLSIGIGQSSVLETVGKVSFTIMCVHGPIYRVLIFIAKAIIQQDSEAIRNNLFFSVCIMVTTILVCLICNRIVSVCRDKMIKVFS